MKVSHSLDWLTFTQHIPLSDIDHILPPLFLRFEEAHPLPHFHAAWTVKPCGIVLFMDRPSDPVCTFQMTGADFSIMHGIPSESDEKILAHMARAGVKATRLDYALDIRGVVADPLETLDLFDLGLVQTSFQKTETQNTSDADAGKTAYFGSRKSDRFVRIYDKAKQLKLLEEAWLRVELVERKEYAQKAADDMHQYGVRSAGTSRLKNVLDFPTLDWWSEAFAAEPVPIGEVPRRPSRWQQWMSTQVLDSIRKRAQEAEDNVFLQSWLLDAMHIVKSEYNLRIMQGNEGTFGDG